eukprot:XP_020397234.1 uncharacterized protein LOC109941142 [Zea mays]
MEEYEALQANHNRDLVPRLSGANVVTGKWIFKQKLKADGSLDRYKAHWVLQGFTQRPEVDYDKTFNPVVKPGKYKVASPLVEAKADTSLFVFHRGLETAYLLYVYNIVLTASSCCLL